MTGSPYATGSVLTLLIISECSLLGASALGEVRSELVMNPGFERTKDGMPAGWSHWAWAPKGAKAMAKCSWEPRGGRGGSAAVRIVVGESAHVGVWCNTPRRIVAEAKGEYRLGVWVRPDVGSAQQRVRLSVGSTSSDWKLKANPTRKEFALVAIEDWQHLVMPVRVPDEANCVRIDIELRSVGAIVIDDVSFVPLDRIDRPPGAPFVTCGRAAQPPTLDGRLDDPCWEEGIECTSFQLTEGRGLAREQTGSWISWDDRNLYVAFLCREVYLDPKLNQLHRFRSDVDSRDGSVWLDDSVEVFLKPHGQEKVYHVIANSRGTVFDQADNTGPRSWDGPIRVAARTSEGQWATEIAIPLASLGASRPASGQVWRANFCRARKPVQEFSSWAPVPRAFYTPSAFGYLAFAARTPRIRQSAPTLSKTGELSVEMRLRNPSGRPVPWEMTLLIGYDGGQEWRTQEDGVLASYGQQEVAFARTIVPAATGGPPRYTDVSYGVRWDGRVLYQSAIHRFKLGAADDPIASRLCHLVAHCSKLVPLDGVHVAEGTAERVVLSLTSVKKEAISEVEVVLDVPDFCTLISPLHQRNCISPTAVSAELARRDGASYRRYRLLFDETAVMASDDLEWDILPIPLFLRVDGAPRDQLRANVYYCATAKPIGYSEKEHALPLTVLPPHSGKRTKQLPFMVWTWWPHYEVTQHSDVEQEAIFSKWASSGFNAVSTELQLNTEHYRSMLHGKFGLKLAKMLPILTAGPRFPGSTEYLKAHPDEAERDLSGKRLDQVCIASLLSGKSAFLRQVEQVLAPLARTYQILQVDYEFGIFAKNAPGYSERNIAMFRKRMGIPESVELSSDALLKRYRKEWVDFRCWQNGEVLKHYRAAIKKANRDCLLSAYSGYQRRDAEHYGVDWRCFAQHVDLVKCGYGRGDYEATRAAIGRDKPFCGGIFVAQPDYDAQLAETRFFRRMTDCGSFMLFYDGMADGRVFHAIARATTVAADLEPFFSPPRRADHLAVCVDTGEPSADISVLTHEQDRVIVLFNESGEPKTLEIRNKDLPAGMVGIDYWSKQLLERVNTVAVDLPPYSVKVILLCHRGRATTAPVPVSPSAEHHPRSTRPVFRWTDNGATRRYILEYGPIDDQLTRLDNIRNSVAQAEDDLPADAECRWRVRAYDVVARASSPWSKWIRFNVPSDVQTAAPPVPRARNASIEGLGHWMPMHWGGYTPSRTNCLARDYAVRRNGPYSLRIIKPKSDVEHPYWTNFRRGPTGTRLVRVMAGETYRFSAWVKAEGESVRSTIKVGFLDESKTYLRGKSATLTGSHDWRQLDVTCRVPPMAVRLTLGLAAPGGAGTSWFDDFELARLD